MQNLQFTNNQPAAPVGDPLDQSTADKVLGLGQASETTIANYRRHSRHFLAFCRRSGGLQPDSVLAFKNHLAKRADLSVGSKNQFLAVAKIYTAALFNLKLMPIDISKDITGKPIKGFKDNGLHKKDGFSPAELAAIRAALAGLGGGFADARLKAIVAMLLTQGLRSAELLAIDFEDIELKAKTARILGKGRDAKERIYLTDASVAALKDWLAAANIRSGAVFVNTRGGRLSRSGLKKLIRLFLEGLGIAGHSAHSFRHSFVDALVASDRYRGRYDQIMRFTRHKSIDMIAVYASEIDMRAEQPHFSAVFDGETAHASAPAAPLAAAQQPAMAASPAQAAERA